MNEIMKRHLNIEVVKDDELFFINGGGKNNSKSIYYEV